VDGSRPRGPRAQSPASLFGWGRGIHYYSDFKEQLALRGEKLFFHKPGVLLDKAGISVIRPLPTTPF